MSIFAKDKNAFCTTNLIVKVRQYKDGDHFFSIDRVVVDSDKATAVAEKLNEVAEIEKDNAENKDWKNQYFSQSLTF